MTNVEEKRIAKLQGKAADLWSGLKALAALTAKMAEESDRPTAENEKRATDRYRKKEYYWGDDVNAASRMAERLADSAEQLVCSLDYMAIQDRGETA